MEFYDVINQRESIRNYDSEKVIPADILERILDAGRVAPSARNGQPWEFIIVQSSEMLNKVKLAYKAEWFAHAPVILIVKGNRKKGWIRSYDAYDSLQTDLTIAMDHMILAAENEGVGTCWIAAFDPSVLHDMLQLNDDEVVFAITPLGYQKEGFQKRNITSRKDLKDIVTYI